jgi:TonB family protein
MARDINITKVILLSILVITMLVSALPLSRKVYESYQPISLVPPKVETVTLLPIREKEQISNPVISPMHTENDDSCTCIEYPAIKKKDPFPYCPECPSDLKILTDTKITYPAAATALGVQGTLELKAYLNNDGKVLCSYIVKSPGVIFSESAVKEVSSWRYTPNQLKNGSGLWCFNKVIINYELSR